MAEEGQQAPMGKSEITGQGDHSGAEVARANSLPWGRPGITERAEAAKAKSPPRGTLGNAEGITGRPQQGSKLRWPTAPLWGTMEIIGHHKGGFSGGSQGGKGGPTAPP